MMKYYLNAIDMGYFANLFVGNVDEAGKVADNDEAMKEAFRLGGELASTVEEVSANPAEVELIG